MREYVNSSSSASLSTPRIARQGTETPSSRPLTDGSVPLVSPPLDGRLEEYVVRVEEGEEAKQPDRYGTLLHDCRARCLPPAQPALTALIGLLRRLPVLQYLSPPPVLGQVLGDVRGAAWCRCDVCSGERGGQGQVVELTDDASRLREHSLGRVAELAAVGEDLHRFQLPHVDSGLTPRRAHNVDTRRVRKIALQVYEVRAALVIGAIRVVEYSYLPFRLWNHVFTAVTTRSTSR